MSASTDAPRRLTVADIAKRYADGQRLPMLTAYDYPTAQIVDEADIPLVLVGVVLLLPITLIVVVRRRLLRVRLTRTELVQGDETVPIARLAGVRPPDGSGRFGMQPFGGHPSVLRHLGVVVVTLDDGTRRAAWARDADGLYAALSALLRARETSS